MPVAYKQDSILSVDSSDLDDFQNQRTGRVELISRLSACISFMLKCHCITSLIDCLNTLPWPHLALFIIHSTCHWPFFFLQNDWEHSFSSGLGYGITLLLCTFISFPVKKKKKSIFCYWSWPKVRCQKNKLLALADTPRVPINSKLYNPTDSWDT